MPKQIRKKKEGEIDSITKLVDKGLILSKELLDTCMEKEYNAEILRLFLNKKIDINVIDKSDKCTLFHKIFKNDNCKDINKVIRLFLEYKGDINKESYSHKIPEFAFLNFCNYLTEETVDLFISQYETPSQFLGGFTKGPIEILIRDFENYPNIIPILKLLINKGIDIKKEGSMTSSIVHEIIKYNFKNTNDPSKNEEK